MKNLTDCEIGIDEWTWLSLSHSKNDFDPGGSFQTSTLLFPFIQAVDINDNVSPKETFNIHITDDVSPTQLRLLHLYYLGLGLPSSEFDPLNFIVDLLVSPDRSFVILCGDSEQRILNIRNFSGNVLIDIDHSSPDSTKLTLRASEEYDVVTNDIRALDIIFQNQSLTALYQLIHGSRLETEKLTT